jgi:hypothetical protein
MRDPYTATQIMIDDAFKNINMDSAQANRDQSEHSSSTLSVAVAILVQFLRLVVLLSTLIVLNQLAIAVERWAFGQVETLPSSCMFVCACRDPIFCAENRITYAIHFHRKVQRQRDLCSLSVTPISYAQALENSYMGTSSSST